jgi:hypothetical protein
MSCAVLLVRNPGSSFDDLKMRRRAGPSLPYPLEITDRGRAGQLRDHPILTG